MQQKKKQLILQALRNSLRQKRDKKLFEYQQSQQKIFNQPQYRQNKLPKRNLYAEQLMNQQKDQQSNGLQKGVQLMIDNTVLLMENLSKLVALNIENSWTVKK